ncbi:hypothetical protein V8E53_013206 [Lactarius tabidus]
MSTPAMLIINALSLLSRIIAHSSSSGHTPPTLSPLFGPLIFGLGPATLPFHHIYLQYLRATNAMEHVLLAFVRWQDAPSNESAGSFGGGPGSASSLGVPTRLKDWIRGYPAMLPEPATRARSQDRLQPRRGARTVRVVSVRRNVRMPLSKCDWERVAPPTLRLTPRYADSFKKRMDLPPNFHPHAGVASSNASIASSATTSSVGDSQADYFGLGKPAIAGEERFRNPTDLKWGEFEAMPTAPIGGTGTTPATKRRFRLPKDIDFETRLASYSDDELNSLNTTNMRSKLSKHERRRSKDDAWVDILVASHSRRATDQDVDMRRRRPGLGPEMASLEVAQVLAGVVRGPPSPPFDGADSSEADIEPMQVPHRSRMNHRGTTPLADDIYEPTIPECEGQHEAYEEERLHETNIRAPVENEVEPPRRSDVTTESVYSSGGGSASPPASPKPKLDVSAPTTTLRLRTTPHNSKSTNSHPTHLNPNAIT